jgi:L-alanine-DL-glutamate epimerase-like enolase superfamily enzyme
MKVGRDRLSEDVARIEAMRELLGPDLSLMVDANMRWSADQAIRAARAFAGHDVYWLEEPTIPDDVAGLIRVVREGGLPVAAGENLHTLQEFHALIAAGGVTFPEPDLSNCGGISVWLKVARLAEAANLPVTSHGVHDLHVHLLAAVPNASYLEVHGFGLERFMAEPLKIEDGRAIAPERPGHGVELDWAALEAHRA